MSTRFQTGRHFDYGPATAQERLGQGRMVKQSLSRIIKAATALEAALKDTDDLPQWVHYKVATAEDRLVMAAHYMLYEINRFQAVPAAKKKVT
jgi:hypothetical protein